MCGIAGYLRLDGAAADRDVLVAMNDAIVHRGPDSAGYLVEGPVALGMRRLAIIDVAGGDQPIHSPDRRASIVYNGESYDFARERARLLEAGRPFQTHSDTETVLALYEERGTAGVEALCGMFAFAIWDRVERRLVLARDRLGKKPLHYYRDEEVFLFASEIKSILVGLARLGRPRPEVEPEALVPYVAYGYVPAPLTAFRGIRKVEPGHRMTVDLAGTIARERYWDVRPAPDDSLSEDEHLERLEATLEEAVRLRMISEVPLGAYLSGGIDSSTVVGLMARVADAPVKTFSIGFEDREFDELRYARMVAEHLGTDHHELVVKPDAAAIIEDLVRHFDEPFADSSAIPTWYVSKMAREHVTVVLSGDGGDELFAGYSRYRSAATGGLGALPLGLRRALFGGVGRALPPGFFGRARLLDLAQDDDGRYVHHVTCGVSADHGSLFHPDFARRVGGTDPAPWYLDRMAEVAGADAVSRRAHGDLGRYLPDDILVKVDRMSMAVSLEARAPLLDHRVVELAARIPTAMKLRDGVSKHILRRLARRLVPAEAIDRKKQGFAIPISRWFNRDWQARTDDLLDGVVSPSRGIFRPEAVARLRDEHRRGRRDHGQLLWSLMMLEMWFRAYVDDRAYGA
ncbi:MAG: asparagine synthase (glutamine-hydrolyzing) [Planctomycetota bacterium]